MCFGVVNPPFTPCFSRRYQRPPLLRFRDSADCRYSTPSLSNAEVCCVFFVCPQGVRRLLRPAHESQRRQRRGGGGGARGHGGQRASGVHAAARAAVGGGPHAPRVHALPRDGGGGLRAGGGGHGARHPSHTGRGRHIDLSTGAGPHRHGHRAAHGRESRQLSPP